MAKHLFTSESVSEGHPDKIADQISDAVLDAILAQDPKARVACETYVKTGMVLVGGEITTSAWVDIEEITRNTASLRAGLFLSDGDAKVRIWNRLHRTGCVSLSEYSLCMIAFLLLLHRLSGRTSNKAMTFFVCFLAALAGLLFGLDIGVIAGALPFITDEFQISAHTQEWVLQRRMALDARRDHHPGHSAADWRLFPAGQPALVMQQFTGMNVIMYYAPKIFELAGYTNTTEQMWGTVIVGLTNVLATFIAIGLVDRWGRKPTLTLGFLVMAAGMGVLGTMMHVGIHSPTAQYFAVGMLLMFIVGFAMSAGPLIWVLCSEIQPLKGRDFGITCSTATNWIANMIVGATFLTMLNTLGNANTFWVYAGLNIFFIVLTIWLVPETKHVSLEHIERNLMKGRPLREIGAHD
ncbi:hypothetical protein L1887_44219 [Cichorium endivia]|nr:hypothetical protein L1887_44219 [Cichorium endivia]